MQITKFYSFLLVFLLLIFYSANLSSAAMVQINNFDQVHFIDFNNDPPAHPNLPNFISSPEVTSGNNFGWHSSTMNTYPRLAGVILDGAFAVTELGFQVHHNPFRDFILQGSTDTTNGFDGTWTDIFSSSVTITTEYAWESWSFENNALYSAYRVKMLNDNGPNVGFGMYRWRLLADDSPAETKYSIIDLGTLGGPGSLGYSINNKGQVTGWAQNSSGDSHAFLYDYTSNSMVSIHNHSSDPLLTASIGFGINESGEVTGTLNGPPNVSFAFLYSGGSMINIGNTLFGNAWSAGKAINNSGQVVGHGPQVFIYSEIAGATYVQAPSISGQGINNLGEVTGGSGDSGIRNSYVYSSGNLMDLGNLGGTKDGEGWDINEIGHVVGFSRTSGDVNHAFYYNGTLPIIDLGTLGGTYSVAQAINESDQIVGHSDQIDGGTLDIHAFLYENGTMHDLNDLIPHDSGWELRQATDINDSGWITGQGYKDNVSRAFILIPNSASTFSSVDQGHYRANGHHDESSQYALTVSGSHEDDGRSFFIFDLSSIGNNIESATLNLFPPGAGTCNPCNNPTVEFEIYSVSTPYGILTASHNDGSGIPIFGDLGSGTYYGTFSDDPYVAESSHSISLLPPAIADMNQAPGFFALGIKVANPNVIWDGLGLGNSENLATLDLQLAQDNDNDDDGFSPPEDCNDDDETIYPGAQELCDGKDNDCNSIVDDVLNTYWVDGDGDGYGDPAFPEDLIACTTPTGYSDNSDDCNDSCAECFPGNTEVCDGEDNNCNGQVDEGVTNIYYMDSDGDSFGDPNSPTQACSAPSGYVVDNTDCDDNCASCYPGATEIPNNGIDEACDGTLLVPVASDSFMRKGKGSFNEGANTRLFVQRKGSKRSRTAVSFNIDITTPLTTATLVLTVAKQAENWGQDGRFVDVHLLNEPFTEGNGFILGQSNADEDRGTGEGVTWKCATDTNISNTKNDCDTNWKGGSESITPIATDSVLHANTLIAGDTVVWDVTNDVTTAVSEGATEVSWIIKKEAEGQNGRVVYYSKDGATAEGNTALAPRLILE